MKLDLVIIESPYAGDIKRNAAYARVAMLWCLRNGMAPFASHLLYTQCLDDTCGADRGLGMMAGFAWRRATDRTLVFMDYGLSVGMKSGITHARDHGHKIEEIYLRKELGGATFEKQISQMMTVENDHGDDDNATIEKVDLRFLDAMDREPFIGGA